MLLPVLRYDQSFTYDRLHRNARCKNLLQYANFGTCFHILWKYLFWRGHRSHFVDICRLLLRMILEPRNDTDNSTRTSVNVSHVVLLRTLVCLSTYRKGIPLELRPNEVLDIV